MHQTETHVLITFIKTVLKNEKKKRYTVIKQSPSIVSLFVYSKYILTYIYILLARVWPCGPHGFSESMLQ